MLYLLIGNILLAVCFGVHIVLSYKERRALSELLAARDLTEYRTPPTEHEHKTLFTKRENRQRRIEEFEEIAQ